jgi:hypothetical protein
MPHSLVFMVSDDRIDAEVSWYSHIRRLFKVELTASTREHTSCQTEPCGLPCRAYRYCAITTRAITSET